jgi:hypothetical protein
VKQGPCHLFSPHCEAATVSESDACTRHKARAVNIFCVPLLGDLSDFWLAGWAGAPLAHGRGSVGALAGV